jgi:hypothetical protein
MSHRIRWICCVLSLTAGLCAARAQEDSPRSRPPPPKPPAVLRFSGPARAGPVCTAGEKTCRIGNYITWCCRADQQCDYSYPGACK